MVHQSRIPHITLSVSAIQSSPSVNAIRQQLLQDTDGVVAPIAQEWTADFRHTERRHDRQTYPPSPLQDVSARYLLHNWADELMPDAFDPFEDKFYTPVTKYGENDRAVVVMNMLDMLADAESIYAHLPDADGVFTHFAHPNPDKRLSRDGSIPLQMVGLIPDDSEMPFLDADQDDRDASVLAVGLLSQGHFKDDSRGSLRQVMEGQYEKNKFSKPWSTHWWNDDQKEIEVFLVEGLADAPGEFPDFSAKALLSRIEKYAHEEQKLMAVPKWAFLSSDGKDLTEYYVNLGFNKVEMEDGLHEYVYMGSYSEEEEVEKQQIMVAMDIWAE